jgi:molybdenum cofactor guanylyltransferase
MLGVVLCGGKSSRMGSDKALLKSPNETTWAQQSMEKLMLLEIPVLFSINQQQKTIYRQYFSEEKLVADNETLFIQGPLRGVISVHLAYPQENLFVLACDMLLVHLPIVKELFNHYQSNQQPGAHVFTNNGEPEPLCGIYTAKALQHIFHLYRTGQLHRHSMKYVLEQVTTARHALADDQKNYFRNINSPADLNGL